MFPFDNQFMSFNISGAELLETLKILQSGRKGLYQFWGIQTTVTRGKDHYVYKSAKMMNG